jgi:hypothetical protein
VDGSTDLDYIHPKNFVMRMSTKHTKDACMRFPKSLAKKICSWAVGSIKYFNEERRKYKIASMLTIIRNLNIESYKNNES